MLAIETQNLHPSTLLCLEALQTVHERGEPQRILDLGCGNGVLGIIAAQLWPEAEVLAADISEKAVADAQRAVSQEGLSERIKVVRSDGFSSALIAQKGPYNVILCNLIADLLLLIAPDVKKHLAPNGYAIIAGSLSWRAETVKQAYKDLGFEIIEKYEDSPWTAYLLCHKSET